jgi:endogenous inhibitor of DNA gyrase (YacG/DUF329 family)
MKLTCKNCSKSFNYIIVTSIPKHCSYRCQRDYRNKRKRERAAAKVFDIKLKCPECNINFIKKSNKSKKKFCSEKCCDLFHGKKFEKRRKLRFKTDKKYKEKYSKLQKIWREKNKDKIKEYSKKAQSKESYKIKRKIYYKKYMQRPEVREHRKKLLKKYYWEKGYREKKKEYKLKNKEYIRKQSCEYAKRPEVRNRVRNQIRQKLKNDPVFILKSRLRTRFYQYVKRGLAKKQVKTSELIGCDWKYLKNHLQKRFKKGMNWQNFGEWHIDHIKPMAHFNLLDVKQQYECCNYKNLKPMWATDNLSKGARYVG